MAKKLSELDYCQTCGCHKSGHARPITGKRKSFCMMQHFKIKCDEFKPYPRMVGTRAPYEP